MTSKRATNRTEFESVPTNQLFDLTLLSGHDGGAEVRMPLKATYVQVEGVVHGGIISTLADTTAVYALLPGVAENERLTSIEFKINFIRPVLLDAGDLRARATIVKRGQTIALVGVDVTQQTRLVAKGLFTYLILDKTR